MAKEEWDKAEDLIDKLLIGKPWDSKILLKKAQLKKQKWIAGGREDYDLLNDAISIFSRCHLLTGSSEAGINTATLLLISGQEEKAHLKASEVAKHCRTQILEGSREPDGYYAAIIAEANLVKGKLDAAESWYETAYSQNSQVAELFKENMNLLLEHLVPASSTVIRIRKALRA